MNIIKLLITGVMVISTSANSQEAKAHLRDFTPKYQIDTFQIEGDIKLLKRRVIESQKAEGIKSAYWDDASHILTVQYNSRLLNLPIIKSFFLYNKPLIIKDSTHSFLHLHLPYAS